MVQNSERKRRVRPVYLPWVCPSSHGCHLKQVCTVPETHVIVKYVNGYDVTLNLRVVDTLKESKSGMKSFL